MPSQRHGLPCSLTARPQRCLGVRAWMKCGSDSLLLCWTWHEHTQVCVESLKYE
jgi:hypothetical protein